MIELHVKLLVGDIVDKSIDVILILGPGVESERIPSQDLPIDDVDSPNLHTSVCFLARR